MIVNCKYLKSPWQTIISFGQHPTIVDHHIVKSSVGRRPNLEVRPQIYIDCLCPKTHYWQLKYPYCEAVVWWQHSNMYAFFLISICTHARILAARIHPNMDSRAFYWIDDNMKWYGTVVVKYFMYILGLCKTFQKGFSLFTCFTVLMRGVLCMLRCVVNRFLILHSYFRYANY